MQFTDDAYTNSVNKIIIVLAEYIFELCSKHVTAYGGYNCRNNYHTLLP